LMPLLVFLLMAPRLFPGLVGRNIPGRTFPAAYSENSSSARTLSRSKHE
jgi:hypothetical protein